MPRLDETDVDDVSGVTLVQRGIRAAEQGGVLEDGRDDAGGGDTGALQEADTVDQEGAGHLPHQGASPPVLLLTVSLHGGLDVSRVNSIDYHHDHRRQKDHK